MGTMVGPSPAALELVPLSRGFRFIHEPLGTADAGNWRQFVGREAELDDLVSRIVLSNGGAFLLTGYRGVGKTTFVNRVIHDVRRRLPDAEALVGPTRVVDVAFNFARPMKPVELLYHVLRGLHRRLIELDVFARLDSTLRQDLELACARTSASVALGNETESQRELGTGDVALGLPGLRFSAPVRFRRAWKVASRRNMTYLAYDEKSAEHDLINVAQRLARGYVERRPRWRRWFNGVPRQRVRLKMLMVFDELDKLEEGRDPSSRSPLDRVLGTLKNLFTTSGIAFVFVAGKELHERWLEDLSKGDSIYESVFAHAQYLPGMWSDAERLCDSMLGDASNGAVSRGPSPTYAAFRKYLAFRGRGIPRRILRGFNEFVRWHDTVPCLGFSPADLRRFRFYAGLFDTLGAAEQELLGRYRGEGAAEQLDKRRLGLFYATDWILQREQQEFTLDDLVASSRRMSRLIAPLEEAAPAELQRLLDVLLRGGYVERVDASGSTVVAGRRVTRPVRYRIPRRRLLELGAFLGVFEQEAQVLFKEVAPPEAPRPVPGQPPSTGDGPWSGRYQIVTQLARGGMSTVHLARDLQTGRDVVVKQLSPGLASDASFRSRAVSEGRVLASFDHPGIVRVFDVLERDDAVAIVMEYVQGSSLAELLRQGPIADIGVATRLMTDIVDAVAYVHGRGVIWRDPKPSNVLLTPQGRVVLIDFGVARRETVSEHETSAGVLIGTPGYMSPEQLRGEPIDARSDLFGLGALCYEILTGKKLYAGQLAEIIPLILGDAAPPRPSEIAPEAAAFDAVLARCLAKAPDDRWTAAELLDALPRDASTPEALGDYVSSLRRLETEREDVGTALVSASLRSVADPSPPPAPVATPVQASGQTGPRLEIIEQGRTVWLPTAYPCRIGRSLDNDIVLDDRAVSRYAAIVRPGETVITTTGDAVFYVEDLNSQNGVFLNGERLTRIQALSDGDVLRIGPVTLRYRVA